VEEEAPEDLLIDDANDPFASVAERYGRAVPLRQQHSLAEFTQAQGALSWPALRGQCWSAAGAIGHGLRLQRQRKKRTCNEKMRLRS